MVTPQPHHFGKKKKKKSRDDLGPEDECYQYPQASILDFIYLLQWRGELSQLFCVSYGLFEGLDKLRNVSRRALRVGEKLQGWFVF